MKSPRCRVIRCCPHCRSYDVRRSHRKGLFEVMVLPLALLRPARCEDCGRRHYTLVFAEGLPAGAETETSKLRKKRTSKTEEEADEGQG
jgi:hypothetical protein